MPTIVVRELSKPFVPPRRFQIPLETPQMDLQRLDAYIGSLYRKRRTRHYIADPGFIAWVDQEADSITSRIEQEATAGDNDSDDDNASTTPSEEISEMLAYNPHPEGESEEDLDDGISVCDSVVDGDVLPPANVDNLLMYVDNGRNQVVYQKSYHSDSDNDLSDDELELRIASAEALFRMTSNLDDIPADELAARLESDSKYKKAFGLQFEAAQKRRDQRLFQQRGLRKNLAFESKLPFGDASDPSSISVKSVFDDESKDYRSDFESVSYESSVATSSTSSPKITAVLSPQQAEIIPVVHISCSSQELPAKKIASPRKYRWLQEKRFIRANFPAKSARSKRQFVPMIAMLFPSSEKKRIVRFSPTVTIIPLAESTSSKYLSTSSTHKESSFSTTSTQLPEPNIFPLSHSLSSICTMPCPSELPKSNPMTQEITSTTRTFSLYKTSTNCDHYGNENVVGRSSFWSRVWSSTCDFTGAPLLIRKRFDDFDGSCLSSLSPFLETVNV
ncbi:hypothetical protein BC829DRAFT_384521 [Chytridium lagenaria]|nr:hypothetical protein BC829DRAFT_384521 [Chytridium lagenaria]